MADEQDALAFRRQVPHDLHQLVDFLGRQHGGGLVKDQYFVLAVQHLEDLGALLHAHGDIADLGVGVHLQAVFFAQLDHALAGLGLVKQSALAHGLHAQDDVVQHRKAFHQLKVLVHHADAQGVGVVGVADLDLLAVLLDDALLRLIQAEEHAHQRGFARAVFTQQRVDLALAQLQCDVVVGDDAGETLGNVQHFNGIFFAGLPRLIISHGRIPPVRSIQKDEVLCLFLTKTPAKPRGLLSKIQERGQALLDRGSYFTVPRSFTVMATAGMASMALETVTSPANILATSAA